MVIAGTGTNISVGISIIRDVCGDGAIINNQLIVPVLGIFQKILLICIVLFVRNSGIAISHVMLEGEEA